jgi:multicomponent K+:H+ antiporter subunit G
MSHAPELPAWAALLVALLVVLGAAFALIGSLGLLRLRSFYERVHPPTLGTTFATGCMVLASTVCFSVLEERLVLRALLIVVFIFLATPVSLTLLVRAARHRDGAQALAQPLNGPPPARRSAPPQ